MWWQHKLLVIFFSEKSSIVIMSRQASLSLRAFPSRFLLFCKGRRSPVSNIVAKFKNNNKLHEGTIWRQDQQLLIRMWPPEVDFDQKGWRSTHKQMKPLLQLVINSYWWYKIVDWVCWFSALLQEVFLQILRFLINIIIISCDLVWFQSSELEQFSNDSRK